MGDTITGAPGSPASVTNVGTDQDAVLEFVIPQGSEGPQGPAGPQGIKGETGAAGVTGATGATGAAGASDTITIRSTITAEPGTPASVTDVGTGSDHILDFVIPRGNTGAEGAAGATGATAPSIYAQQGKCRNHAAFSTLQTIKQPL